MKIKKALFYLALCFSFVTILAAISGKFSVSAAENYEMKVLELVNEQRAAYGLSALEWSDAAYQVAQTRANEVLTTFSHTRPNGTYFSTAFTEAGINYTFAAENIAYGYTTPESVVSAWMASDSHRANILSANVTYLGVAMVTGGANSPAWAQEFFSGTAPSYSYNDYEEPPLETSEPTPAPTPTSTPDDTYYDDYNQADYNNNWYYTHQYQSSNEYYSAFPKYQPDEWNTNLQSKIPDDRLVVWYDGFTFCTE